MTIFFKHFQASRHIFSDCSRHVWLCRCSISEIISDKTEVWSPDPRISSPSSLPLTRRFYWVAAPIAMASTNSLFDNFLRDNDEYLIIRYNVRKRRFEAIVITNGLVKRKQNINRNVYVYINLLYSCFIINVAYVNRPTVVRNSKASCNCRTGVATTQCSFPTCWFLLRFNAASDIARFAARIRTLVVPRVNMIDVQNWTGVGLGHIVNEM